MASVVIVDVDDVRFKDRHSITWKSIVSEAASVEDTVLQARLDKHLDRIFATYDHCDIYNTDETGLFLQLLPAKTLASKDDKCVGTKTSKGRVTVMVGVCSAVKVGGFYSLLPGCLGTVTVGYRTSHKGPRPFYRCGKCKKKPSEVNEGKSFFCAKDALGRPNTKASRGGVLWIIYAKVCEFSVRQTYRLVRSRFSMGSEVQTD
ncbi:hypothetical protein HPB47_015389 [Ixodes persulcatus]|uniref:Uncharacterized protein n=1 Tax=Ixodes persulcatus TaxID=34615 RepID=A0AC60QTR2_IXOPE|nr:hypothetical protein HPB47_015389 [Ixodes persulcatus]